MSLYIISLLLLVQILPKLSKVIKLPKVGTSKIK